VKRIHYAWVVAGVTWITLLASAGFRSTPSVLIVPLEHEFGWSRATISLAVSINLMLFGLFAPFAGGLMERFGVRRVVIGALLTVSAGSGLTIFMNQSWQLDLLWGVVVGTGTGSMATVLAAIVANRWFRSAPRPGARSPDRSRRDGAAHLPAGTRLAGGEHRLARIGAPGGGGCPARDSSRGAPDAGSAR